MILLDWGEERLVDVSGWSGEAVCNELKKLVHLGESLPKSAESDICLYAPIIDAGTQQEDIKILNLTYDGQTVRQHPNSSTEPAQTEETYGAMAIAQELKEVAAKSAVEEQSWGTMVKNMVAKVSSASN